MEKNKSSASSTQIMPQGEPAASFITETGKSGDYGDRPINCESLDALQGTNKTMTTEDFASKKSTDEVSGAEIEPQGEPSSTYINTSAVK